MSTHRVIWVKNFGEIPKDEEGRTFEIHHKDGNRTNNSIDNLMCISIQEHLNIHQSQGDWGAAMLIAKRMNLPADYIAKLQTGKKRPELIGKCGPKLGNIPWNKGVTGYNLNVDRRGKRHTSKLNKDIVNSIKKDYISHIQLENNDLVGKVAKNGRILTYEQLFSKEYAKKYKVSTPTIKNIIFGKYWTEGVVDVRI